MAVKECPDCYGTGKVVDDSAYDGFGSGKCQRCLGLGIIDDGYVAQATQEQRDIIERLRLLHVTDRMGETPKECSYQDAADAIAWAQQQPRRPEYIITGELDVGAYTNGVDLYRIKRTRRGYLVVYQLLIRYPEPGSGERKTYSARYQGGSGSLLDDIRYNCMALTVDQAEVLSLSFGQCIVCGRKLTDPKSVRKGIGPVCLGRLNQNYSIQNKGR